MRSALADYDLQIRQTTQSLAEFKSRALSAEAELSEINTSAGRLAEVQQELKDKTALIAKLRHESEGVRRSVVATWLRFAPPVRCDCKRASHGSSKAVAQERVR